MNEQLKFIDFDKDQFNTMVDAGTKAWTDVKDATAWVEDLRGNTDDPVIEQGSEAWLQLRTGKITASCMSDVMAKGQGVTRNKYMCKLAAERLTGAPIKNGYTNASMQRGTELEPEARLLYEIQHGVEVVQVPIVMHPTISNSLCSPDGLVGDDGLVEIKCPDLSTHIGYLLDRKIPRNYQLQMLWQMACTDRKWCDFVSYCPDMPTRLRMLVVRLKRGDAEISGLENAVIEFDKEVDDLVTRLMGL